MRATRTRAIGGGSMGGGAIGGCAMRDSEKGHVRWVAVPWAEEGQIVYATAVGHSEIQCPLVCIVFPLSR